MVPALVLCSINMSLPAVSVIMNCLNGEQYLREAIDSVYAQSFQDWEIIFWDNASTDNSAEIATGYDGKLKYFRGSETVPLGQARNLALERARGEYITFLDCDDMWLPDKLQKQIAVLGSNEDVCFLYGNCFQLIGGKKRYLGFTRPQPQGNVFRSFLTHYPVNLQTVMIRKAVLEQFEDPFDPKLTVAEEFDLFLRVLYRCQAAYIHDPLVVYRIHENMSSLKHMTRYPIEIEYVMGKLINVIPGFQQQFAHELRYLEAKLGYWKAKGEMIVGNNKKARDYLDHHKYVNTRFFLLYCLTYFPRSIWLLLHDMKDKCLLS